MTSKKRLLPVLSALTVAMLLGACGMLPSRLNPFRPKPSETPTPPRTNADATLQVRDLKRLYDLHVPASIKAQTEGQKTVPLVLAFHGKGGNGQEMEQATQFNQLADQKGFIVAYPDSIGGHWDARRSTQPETANDVGFISTLIDQLAKEYPIDRQRVYIAGFSNGGMFTHRLACELSDKVAAGAVVSAAMPANLSGSCKPSEPVPMLLINGTEDPAIPYSTPGKGLLTVPETAKFWRTHNRCDEQVTKKAVANAPNITVETYQSCSQKAMVVLYTIQGGQHVWPVPQPAASNAATAEPQGISASEIIWDFFSKYPTK